MGSSKKKIFNLHAQKFGQASASRERDARDFTPLPGYGFALRRLARSCCVVAGHAQRLQIAGIKADTTIFDGHHVVHDPRRDQPPHSTTDTTQRVLAQERSPDRTPLP
jgi:hypothetical protein